MTSRPDDAARALAAQLHVLAMFRRAAMLRLKGTQREQYKAICRDTIRYAEGRVRDLSRRSAVRLP